jgi:hypothetical protein
MFGRGGTVAGRLSRHVAVRSSAGLLATWPTVGVVWSNSSLSKPPWPLPIIRSERQRLAPSTRRFDRGAQKNGSYSPFGAIRTDRGLWNRLDVPVRSNRGGSAAANSSLSPRRTHTGRSWPLPIEILRRPRGRFWSVVGCRENPQRVRP